MAVEGRTGGEAGLRKKPSAIQLILIPGPRHYMRELDFDTAPWHRIDSRGMKPGKKMDLDCFNLKLFIRCHGSLGQVPTHGQSGEYAARGGGGREKPVSLGGSIQDS